MAGDAAVTIACTSQLSAMSRNNWNNEECDINVPTAGFMQHVSLNLWCEWFNYDAAYSVTQCQKINKIEAATQWLCEQWGNSVVDVLPLLHSFLSHNSSSASFLFHTTWLYYTMHGYAMRRAVWEIPTFLWRIKYTMRTNSEHFAFHSSAAALISCR